MPGEANLCYDNFFKKMTDLDSPKKNNDCYFYYYSTCMKGDSCTFRHEPSALGCETVCSFWREGKCVNVHCNFRHMELRKNRKVIPCYWESQPGGCLKPHCPFMHQSPKTGGGAPADKSGNMEKSEPYSPDGCKNAPGVDTLVVNFEEESDNESAPTTSPFKNLPAAAVKTLEEIKLEKVQAEAAAFYSYPDAAEPEAADPDDLRQRILDRLKSKKQNVDRKLSNEEMATILGDNSLRGTKRIIAEETEASPKKQKKDEPNPEFKIKTLEEIRAERARKQIEIKENETKKRKMSPIQLDRQKIMKVSKDEESEVTSTCSDDQIEANKVEVKPEIPEQIVPIRKLNLKRIKDAKEVKTVEKIEEKQNVIPPEIEKTSKSDLNKTVEALLSDDDEDLGNIPLKDEEELLNEIDYFLND